MSVNDSCRFCKEHLRIKGTLTNTKKIFESNKLLNEKSVHERLIELGLTLSKDNSRSARICRSCLRLLVKIEDLFAIFARWQEAEKGANPEASTSAVEKWLTLPCEAAGSLTESADSTTLSSPDEHNPDVPMATPLFVISTPFSSPAPAVMCSDDEGTSTGGSSSFTAPSPSKPAKKRKRGHDILETIDDLRREQVVNCTALISHINTLTQDRDEHMTFALAIADSLRKLPKERVEATKLKLFSVLSEAHMQ